MNKPVWMTYIIEIFIGALLASAYFFGFIDHFWSGMGIALIIVGTLRLFKTYRICANPDYMEKIEIEATDERNRFIAMKAWSWAGYLYVMIAAVGAIAFKLAGREDLMMFCSGSVCLVVVLYWSCYLVLKRKY